MTFTGLTTQMCADVFEIMFSAQQTAFELNIVNKLAGTIVILDPYAMPSSNDPRKVDFDEVRRAALFICRVGQDRNDDEEYEAAAKEYDDMALIKARDMWVLRPFGITSGRDIQQNFSHLYQSGMIKWGGGTCRDGIVIGFSGVQENFDEAIAGTFNEWLIALCREEVTKKGGVMDGDSSFIQPPDGDLHARLMGRAAIQRHLGP